MADPLNPKERPGIDDCTLVPIPYAPSSQPLYLTNYPT